MHSRNFRWRNHHYDDDKHYEKCDKLLPRCCQSRKKEMKLNEYTKENFFDSARKARELDDSYISEEFLKKLKE